MDKKFAEALARTVQSFSLPRYNQLPNDGLYLEQTVKYINKCLAPLGYIEITGSMVRNYVKQGLVTNPVNKLYYADHIGYLIAITILKQVAPLESISKLFFRQRDTYDNHVAYDYFCNELENMLFYCFGLKDTVDEIGVTHSIEKQMLRAALISVSNMIYLHACFSALYDNN